MPDHRITPIRKTDLQYEYPKGAAGDDDPSKRGIPDSVILNRSEWYEMLYFCNKFANEHRGGNEFDALKAERMIKDEIVPAEIHGQEKIRSWLLRNWDFFPKA